jgi:hypothetical protein
LTVLVVATTAFAAWYFLKPADIAKKMDDSALSEAFKSDDAIEMNESVTSGDYIFTLLGVVSGKDLSSSPVYSNDVLQSDRIYIALAVQKQDGTSMEGYNDYNDGNEPIQFFSSPIIKGMHPQQASVMTLKGSYREKVIDGVLYRIVDCNSVAEFAGQGLSLIISDGGPFFNRQAFIYDEATGETSVNSEYEGACAVFALPENIPITQTNVSSENQSNAATNDEVKQTDVHSDDNNGIGRYTNDGVVIDERTSEQSGASADYAVNGWRHQDSSGNVSYEFEGNPSNTASGTEDGDNEQRQNVTTTAVSDDTEQMLPPDFDSIDWDKATPIESTIKQLNVSENGEVIYSYDCEYGGGTVSVLYAENFNDSDTEQSKIVSISASDHNIIGVRFTKHKDGTLTGAVVLP